jgi:hypothetical protein
MDKLIFACLSSGKDFSAALWAASIRKFAGSLANSSIWVIIPDSKNITNQDLETELRSLEVKVIDFEIDLELRKFPFAEDVKTAAITESLAESEAEILVWMNTDTMIINEPSGFNLRKDKNLGYRPVHHTLVGSIYNKPIDPFWKLVYDKCHVSEEKIFPMKTHVDHNTLRPYFNAGFLIVRPALGLLQYWWKKFNELYLESEFKEFYQKNDLYSIFIHQAILAGVILNQMEKSMLQELPFEYNYPLHLLHECPEEYIPIDLNDLKTVRYENTKILKAAKFKDPQKSWISQQLKH